MESLSSLQSLDLSFNNIAVISQPAINLPELWRLNFANNLLEAVRRPDLERLEGLQILDISSNRISEVEAGSFDKNTLLKVGKYRVFIQCPKITKIF